MENLIKIDWTKENAGKLLDAGFKLFQVFSPDGFAYVFSRDLPIVPDAFIVSEIPPKFAREPRLYDSQMWLNSFFWYAFAADENDKEFIFSEIF